MLAKKKGVLNCVLSVVLCFHCLDVTSKVAIFFQNHALLKKLEMGQTKTPGICILVTMAYDGTKVSIVSYAKLSRLPIV
jgi:hypothetical protein